MAFLAFQLVVDLEGALAEQEQAAADQDQIAAGDRMPERGEQRRGQPDDPGQREQQQHAGHHRAEQAQRGAPSAAAAGGSLPDRIEMKMMLSTPRTISRNVSVASAIQISGR